MTLKEQFKKEIIAAPVMDEVIDYWVIELEQTADEFAIGFAKYVLINHGKYKFVNLEKMLYLFKKEKGL